MTTPLLTTKLHIPPVQPELVSRPRLTQRLNDGVTRRLTLVSAPAGFGKTMLLAEWASDFGLASATDRAGEAPQSKIQNQESKIQNLKSKILWGWLSLDEGDNDPARFFAYLVAALQSVDPDVGQSAQAMLQAPQPPPPESLLTALINDIATVPGPFVLVLDDYHLIHTLPIHRQLAFLLEHQPPQMHLVIASREDPPLPLSRLRARGQMAEIRQADLRFTEEEATQFLRRVAQLEISDADVASLQQRTEGWIAGLQLLALSIRGRDDAHQVVQAFTGSHRYVLDYLVEEVFERQSAELQEFLLKTSILERFTAPLCDAVTGQDDGREALLALEQANLFIVPLDVSRQWYRYHHLFADLLQHRLEVESRHDATQLHRRASRWYADNGFPEDAVRHALVASDWERVADLILSGVSESLLRQGRMVTLLGWYQALPEEVVRADPYLSVERSWPLILTEQLDAAEPYLALAEQAAQEQGDEALMGAVLVGHVQIARVRGDNRRAMELSERALDLLPADHMSGRSVVAVNLGIAQWFQGRMAEAEETLMEAEGAGRGSGNDYARYASLIFLGRIQAARGKPHRAAESCRRMIQQGGQMSVVALAHYDLARLLYEWNDLDTAADHLRQGIKLSERGSPEFQAGGYGTLAFVEQARGNAAAAQDALRKAAELLENPGISPATRLYNLVSRILVALGQGDLDTAARAAEQAPEPDASGSFPDYLFLMLAQARLLLAQGQEAAAAEQLAGLHGMATHAGWQSAAIQARALQALAASAPEKALAFLTEALALAKPAGYVRTFVDAGEQMRALLQEAAANGIMVDYANELLAAYERSKFQVSGYRPPSDLRPGTMQPETLIEPLSDRELDVLHPLRRGPDQPGDRPGAVHLHQHRQDPPQEHLRQAGRQQPPPGDCQGRRTRSRILVPNLQHPFPGSPPQITHQSPVAGDDTALYFLLQ